MSQGFSKQNDGCRLSESFIAEKEREVLALRAKHALSMEAQLRTKEAEALECTRKLEILTSDFSHNLRILGERDAIIQRLQKQAETAGQESLEWKSKLEEALQALASSKAASDRRECDLLNQIAGMKNTIDTIANNAQKDRHRLMHEFDKERARIRNKMRDVDELLEEQRQEMTAMFDKKICSHEIEFHCQKDSLKLKFNNAEAKYNDTIQLLEEARRKEADNDVCREKLMAEVDEAKRKSEQADSKCDDIMRFKDSQIAEIEREKSKQENENLTNGRKISELLQSLHEVEKAFIAHCYNQSQRFETDRRKLIKENCNLQASIETVKTETMIAGTTIQEMQERIQGMEKSEYVKSIKLKLVEHAKTEAKEEVLSVEVEVCDLKQEREYLKSSLKAKEREIQLLAKALERLKQIMSTLEEDQVRNEKIANGKIDALLREKMEVEGRLTEQRRKSNVQISALHSRIEQMAAGRAGENGATSINDKSKRKLSKINEAETANVFALLSDHNSCPLSDAAPKSDHEMMKSLIKVDGHEELLQENQQLQLLVSMMRKEMEDLGQQATGSVYHHAGEKHYGNDTEDPYQESKHRRSNLVWQQGSSSDQLALKHQISELLDTIKSLRRQNRSLKRKADELEKMIRTSDCSEGQSYLDFSETDQILSLKEKIGDMTNELDGVIFDRNRLQDLSNKLQVQLNKSKRDRSKPMMARNSVAEANFPTDHPSDMQFSTVGDESCIAIRGKPHFRPHTSQGRTTQSQRSAFTNLQNKERRRVQARAAERRTKVRNWSILDTDSSER